MARAYAFSRIRRTLVIACCAAMVSLVALPMDASASTFSPSAPTMPSTFGSFAPDPGGDVSPLAESGNITAGSCTYRQVLDDPHPSSGDTSVHGWWRRISGTCPSRANVDVYLQAYWCDVYGCRWITVASGSGDYRAGGGSGRRATARRTCSAASTVGWRGFVDVDLIGVDDPAGYTYSPIRNLACRP
jgi:hypothetical protein